MSSLSHDTKHFVLPEAARLGYDDPVMTKAGHLLFTHRATGEKVVASGRLQGRAVQNACAQLRRSARVSRHATSQGRQ